MMESWEDIDWMHHPARYQIYLLSMPHMRIPSLKIGVTGVDTYSDRVEILSRRHRATLEGIWILQDWDTARLNEWATLQVTWRHFRASLTEDDMPRGGFTETRALADVSIDQAITDIDRQCKWDRHVKRKHQFCIVGQMYNVNQERLRRRTA